MSSSQSRVSGTVQCDCQECASLRSARAAVNHAALIIKQSRGNVEQLIQLARADMQLAEAASSLHPSHKPEIILTTATAQQWRQIQAPSLSPTRAHVVGAVKSSLTQHRESMRDQLRVHLWTGPNFKPMKEDGFQHAVRDRARVLGILRRVPLGGFLPPKTAQQATLQSIAKVRAVIVCDHCRSHGLRCNEAPVCNNCIWREVPCIHRQCDLSPKSRAVCPRSVCLYVHDSWMPTVHGTHDPKDPNWIILPGRMPDHLSAGQLAGLSEKSDAKIWHCYQTFAQRQKDAVETIKKIVQAGISSWEDVKISCLCIKMERGKEPDHIATENFRHLALEGAGEDADCGDLISLD